MKKVDPKRMLAGLHQVVFWSGTAQQGYGAKAKVVEKKLFAKSAPAVATGGGAPAVAETQQLAPAQQENKQVKNASAVAVEDL